MQRNLLRLPVVTAMHLLHCTKQVSSWCLLESPAHPACLHLMLPPLLLLARSLSAFEIRSKLYAGHISSVYRAVDKKSGITVGLKLYKRTKLNDMERHQIAREIWLHIQLNHPSIIALYAAWKDKDYIYLVLEWAPEVGW
eukprot:GHUV01043055.1.p1 GENE.GHUV01043055.1~~GHUV01043055.1.p1  ORF type:complete len:140 (+),score=29.86 GHUV01043055.1:285-704(+)